jgi:hypothetical protein
VKVLRHLVRADSFTDPDNTDLRSHTPDKGSSWVIGLNTYVGSSEYLAFQIASNAAVPAHSSINVGLNYFLHPELPGCEYAVEVRLPTVYTSTFSSYTAGVVARATNPQNFYSGFTRSGVAANDKAIYKCVAGVFTLIAQADSGTSAGDVLRLEVENGAQRLYQNDVLRVSGADTALTAAGSAGIGLGAGLDGVGSTTNDWSFDDFKVYLFGGPLSRDEGGVAGAVKIVTAATYNVTSRDRLLICDTTSNVITINLPPAGQELGRELEITNIGAVLNDVTVEPDGSETIDSFGNSPVGDGFGKTIRSTSNTEWWTVGASSV